MEIIGNESVNDIQLKELMEDNRFFQSRVQETENYNRRMRKKNKKKKLKKKLNKKLKKKLTYEYFYKKLKVNDPTLNDNQINKIIKEFFHY